MLRPEGPAATRAQKASDLGSRCLPADTDDTKDSSTEAQEDAPGRKPKGDPNYDLGMMRAGPETPPRIRRCLNVKGAFNADDKTEFRAIPGRDNNCFRRSSDDLSWGDIVSAEKVCVDLKNFAVDGLAGS